MSLYLSRRHSLFLAGCAFALVSNAQTAETPQDPLQVEAPDLNIGDSWGFVRLAYLTNIQTGEFTATVASVEDTKIRLATGVPGGKTKDVVTDKEGRLWADTTRAFDPPKQTYSYPLVIGKKWKYSTVFPFASCGTSRIDFSAEVVKWESVTVPAGTFRALRIDHDGRWTNCHGSDTHKETYWYVPALKTSVKSETVWGTIKGRDGYTHALLSVALK